MILATSSGVSTMGSLRRSFRTGTRSKPAPRPRVTRRKKRRPVAYPLIAAMLRARDCRCSRKLRTSSADRSSGRFFMVAQQLRTARR